MGNYNTDSDSLIVISKYIKKLLLLIKNDKDFELFSNYYIKRNRIDDILCCIEAELPDFFKTKSKDRIKPKNSVTTYQNILSLIKAKFFIISNQYYCIPYNNLEIQFC